MIARISERRAFERLTRDGRRARTATLWCRYLDEPGAVPPRVAFAIGRTVGSAVTRNRVRRRLRAIVRHVAIGDLGLLPHGWLLIGARPEAAEQQFDGLEREVSALLHAVRPAAVLPS